MCLLSLSLVAQVLEIHGHVPLNRTNMIKIVLQLMPFNHRDISVSVIVPITRMSSSSVSTAA